MEAEATELVGHKMGWARHEARANAECLRAKPEVKACRLDLVVVQIALAGETSRLKERGYRAIRQNSCFASHHAPSIFAGDKTKLKELTQA